MSSAVTWKAIKNLHLLYEEGVTKYTPLYQVSLFRYLFENQRLDLEKKQIVVCHDDFYAHYEKNFLNKYKHYFQFLGKYNLLQFDTLSEKSIENLQVVEQHKTKIQADKDMTLKELSSRYFDNSKQIKKDYTLYKAVCKVSGKSEFCKKQQFLKILHSLQEEPDFILLCENDNQLNKSRKQNIEVWVAGGYNVPKLDFIPIPDIPIFYLCDFDKDGMNIYQKVKQHITDIQLIIPENYKRIAKSIQKTNHHSHWTDFNIKDFKTEPVLFTVLQFLINEDKWIEEESIDFTIS